MRSLLAVIDYNLINWACDQSFTFIYIYIYTSINIPFEIDRKNLNCIENGKESK